MQYARLKAETFSTSSSGECSLFLFSRRVDGELIREHAVDHTWSGTSTERSPHSTHNMTEWFAEKPDFQHAFVTDDNFVVTRCKKHRGGYLCKMDGNFKFPSRGKKRRISPVKKEILLEERKAAVTSNEAAAA